MKFYQKEALIGQGEDMVNDMFENWGVTVYIDQKKVKGKYTAKEAQQKMYTLILMGLFHSEVCIKENRKAIKSGLGRVD